MSPASEPVAGLVPQTGLNPSGEPLKLGQHARKLARSIYSGSVTATLREAIISGQFAEGAALVERTLAEQLQVSRGPVRNALYALEGEGLARTLPNGRMVVNRFDAEDVADLLAVRFDLESSALRWAGERDYDLGPVLDVVSEMESEGTSNERLVDLDINFHRALVELSGSRFLLQSWLAIAPVVHTVITLGNRTLEKRDPASNFKRIMKSHYEIVRPLKAGDTAKAAKKLSDQFRFTNSMFDPAQVGKPPKD